MKFPSITCTILLFILRFASSFVKPESDGRSYFAVVMGNILQQHSKSCGKNLSFTISPAAVQKSLAILYNSAEDSTDLLDIMLMEMGLKYLDAMRLMEDALEGMTSFDVLKEDRLEKLDKPIKRTDVLEYFNRDFHELGDDMHFSTLITAPSASQLSSEFCKFAVEFFNATVLLESDPEVRNFYRNSESNASTTTQNSLNVCNEIVYTVNWKPQFIEEAEYLLTRGHFRYGEIFDSNDAHVGARILELPLEAKVPLSILLIIPTHAEDLSWTTNYEVIRPLTHSSTISRILKDQMVEVKLTKTFIFETQTDLIDYLGKHSITRAKIYEAPQKFKRFFKGPSHNGVRLGKFWQNVKLKVEAKIVDELPQHRSGFFNAIKEKIIDLTQTETFDVSETPFLFVLKSDEVIYFMGHYYGHYCGKFESQ